MKFCLPCALITELKATECNTNQSSWSHIQCVYYISMGLVLNSFKSCSLLHVAHYQADQELRLSTCPKKIALKLGLEELPNGH